MMTFRNPGQALDYQRFMSDALRDILVGEISAIRAECPDAKVTANGLLFHRPADYWEWYRHVDIAAWDSYPDPAAGLADIRAAAFSHDLFRCLRGGQPFMLMEQVTSQVNWRATNVLKAPGQMRAISLQAVAHGADAVMFFQWRAAKAGAEKFHGAMVPHYGTGGRVFREVCELGAELKKLSEVAGARTAARVAILVSWENRWALELESKPMAFDYAGIVHHYHGALWDLNVPIDVTHPDHAFDGYAVLVLPALYQLTQTQAKKLRAFVRRGGLLVMSYFSGVADERDHIWLGGYPALLQDVLGLVVEEWQPLLPGETNSLIGDDETAEASCTNFCELLHTRGAEIVAKYGRGFYAGMPAVTRHRFEKGEACYVATQPDRAWLTGFFRELFQSRGICAPVDAGPGVEAVVRVTASAEYLFVINHEAASGRVVFGDWQGTDLLSGQSCGGEIMLEPFGVRVVRRRLNSTR
jgi:beta-galactosidase